MAHKCLEAPPEAWGHEKWCRRLVIDELTKCGVVGLTAAQLAQATGLRLETVQWKLQLLLGLEEVGEIRRWAGRGAGRTEVCYVTAAVHAELVPL